MSLKSDGFRFIVSPDRKRADWVHQSELATRCPDLTDCTEMSDAEFDAFMGADHAAIGRDGPE